MSNKYNRSLIVGSILWIASMQYYVFQLIVASAWNKDAGYSWAHHTISDLANTACAPYGDRFVCSPLHDTMNLSFIMLGITMIIGAGLLSRQLASAKFTKFGFAGMALAGLGTILVGLYPENSPGNMHVIGAAMSFIFGNFGPLIIGLSRSLAIPTWLRVYSVATSVVGLAALLLFLFELYLGLGIGGMERVISYPQSLWMITFGVYILTQTLRSRNR